MSIIDFSKTAILPDCKFARQAGGKATVFTLSHHFLNITVGGRTVLPSNL